MKEYANHKKQWTSQEEQLLFKLQLQYGNKWSIISTHIPGDKQDNHVKNKFYSTLRKGFRKMNKYITNVRRKIYNSEIAVNKLLKPEFLTKLTAVADRNFFEKYEVKQKAVDLSQMIQQKLIVLSKNTDEYQRIHSRQFTFQQLLLGEIQQFNRNCKKRKGKRKAKAKNSHNELYQSQSVSEVQMIEEDRQNSQKEGRQKKQENQQMEIKIQKGQQEQMHENIIIKLLPGVIKQTQDKNIYFPFQDQKIQQNNDYIRTPNSMISTHMSLKNFMNSSPLINNRTNFQQALLAFPFKMQTSLLISKNSQISMNMKSAICKQKTNMNFLQDIPMAKQSSNALLFTSAQIGRISEYQNQQRSEFSRKLSTSQGQNHQKSCSNLRKSQVEASKFYYSQLINKVSTIDEQKQYLQRQLQSQQKMQK